MNCSSLSFVISSPLDSLRINSVQRSREIWCTVFGINSERRKSDSSTSLCSAQSDSTNIVLRLGRTV